MELKKTITSIFMVPTLKIDREKLKSNEFINAYISDGSRDVQYKNSIYLLFNPKNVDKFKVFLDDEYERTKTLIDDYDYEGGFVVLVYELNMKFKKDFGLIKLGKYSKTSPEFQAMFPKVVKLDRNGMKKDFGLIKMGKYSKTSPEFQALFPNVVKIELNGIKKDDISLQYRVFNQTDDLKEYWQEKLGVEFDDSMEVWQGFIEENETLFIEKLKEQHV